MRRVAPSVKNKTNDRSGLSLFEVIVSISVFALAASMLYPLLSTGMQAQTGATLKTEAALYAESTMNELSVGMLELSTASGMPLNEGDPAWMADIEVVPGDDSDLLTITVTASHVLSDGSVNGTHTLTRVMRDPEVYYAAAEAEAEAAAEEEL